MSPKPIVVGVEDSVESRHALAFAWKIAEAAQAELVVVHAVPDLWLATGLNETPVVLPEVQDALTRASRAQIERVVAEVLPHSAARRLEVRAGPAAFAVADVARQRRAELVVLGGKHHTALARTLGRSTVHYLVRTLDIPVLVVGPATGPATRVLAAVDLSDAAIRTIKAGERYAKLLGGKLRIVHVIEPLHLLLVPVEALDQAAYARYTRQAFEDMIAPLPATVLEDQVVRTGPAVETIVAEVAVWHANILVVGSHGKGWVDRLLIGSTTEHLLNALPASVLIVPTTAATPKKGRSAKRHVQHRRSRASVGPAIRG
jgi:nucleotide-binding universal stress UspA family protein